MQQKIEKHAAMAVCSSLSVLSANSVPKLISASLDHKFLVQNQFKLQGIFGKSCGGSTRLNARFAEIEPDLREEPRDQFALNSVSAEDFKYGEWDGHHTYFEGEHKGTFWGDLAKEIAATEPPTGFQGLISWLFPPAVAAAVFFNVPGEYLYIGAGLFTIIFCIIEMDKPDEPHNFEPQIYNMDRGVRDKLINDYNTMDIWDFNEKYGDLWDFTVKQDDKDIMNR